MGHHGKGGGWLLLTSRPARETFVFTFLTSNTLKPRCVLPRNYIICDDSLPKSATLSRGVGLELALVG